jgi:hypothetical protein
LRGREIPPPDRTLARAQTKPMPRSAPAPSKPPKERDSFRVNRFGDMLSK